MKNNDKRVAKRLLEEAGIKVFQKDIKSVVFENKKVVRHELAGGTLAPDYYPHKQVVTVGMEDGTSYILDRETVDKDGNYSEGSALWATKSVKTA